MGTVTAKQVEEIAKVKLPDLNCQSLEAAVKTVAGTAVRPRFCDYGADSNGLFSIEFQGTDATAQEWVKKRTV